MSPTDDESRLRDMLDNAKAAVEAVRGRKLDDCRTDAILPAALERFVEIVGEAASRVSDARQETLPGIPWRPIIAMRHRLVHGYMTIDPRVIWDVITDDLPPLIAQLEQELGDG
ncbi:MAG: DUF86 domain-containing protein [Phycisphaerales bacterium]|nr:DUF86 domain-containing protein [Phycisphaerales bacterium]